MHPFPEIVMTPGADEQARTDLLVTGTRDDLMRQNFSMGLKGFVQGRLLPGLTPVFEGRASKSFKREHGRDPVDRQDIRKAMVVDPYFQSYASTNRVAQELIWELVLAPLSREADALDKSAAELSKGAEAALETSENFEVPRYVSAIDIHCMPGGYAPSAAPHSVAAGALYDRGVYLYSMGMMGPDNDDMGRSVCNYIKRHMPGFQPHDILDMGCTVGHSTLPFKEQFPEAEVTGVDVAGPCLRYAHARAQAMGHNVAFKQRNAAETGFEDGSFDLIVSHIMLHETSGKAMPQIFRECYRLLKPGGVMIHADLPPFEKMGPFMQFILDNETYYNNEPFWGAMRQIDQVSLAVNAGFAEENVKFDSAPMAGLDTGVPTQADDSPEFVAGEYAPGGAWEILIGKKAD